MFDLIIGVLSLTLSAIWQAASVTNVLLLLILLAQR